MNQVRPVLPALLLCLAVVAPCCAEEVQCPKRMNVASGSIVSPDLPSGYRAMVSNTAVSLSGVTVFDGPPEEEASLKPSFAASGESFKWVFDGGNERGIWISCDYASGLVRFVKKVSGPVSACTATVRKKDSGRSLEARFYCE